MLIYFHQGDEYATPPVAFGLDDTEHWWSGDILKSGASLALAAAMSITAAATGIAANLQWFGQDEVSAGSLHGQPDEDFWINPVPPIIRALRMYQQWIGDEQIPAGRLFGQDDEDFWINPVPPVALTHYVKLPILPDTEEVTAVLFGQPDEDFWNNPVKPVAVSLIFPQPWIFDAQEPGGSLTGQPDEDLWINPVAPVSASNLWPFPWVGDVQEPFLHGMPDEDLDWRLLFPPPVAASNLPMYWFDQSQEASAPATFQGAEEIWPLRPMPTSDPLPFVARDDDQFVPAATSIVDEDIWWPLPRQIESGAQCLPRLWDDTDSDLPISKIYELLCIDWSIVPALGAAAIVMVPNFDDIGLDLISAVQMKRVAVTKRSSGELTCIATGCVPALVAGGGQMAGSLIAFELNDQFVTVFGLSRALQAPTDTPDWVTDATGTATLYDNLGNIAAGPLTFANVAGPVVMPNGQTSPDGNYEAPLPASFDGVVGKNYVCKITLVSGAGGTFHVEAPTVVKVRTQ